MPVGVAARRPREAPHVAVNPETERQLEETRAKIELLQNVTEERMRSLTRDELVGVVGDLLALAARSEYERERRFREATRLAAERSAAEKTRSRRVPGQGTSKPTLEELNAREVAKWEAQRHAAEEEVAAVRIQRHARGYLARAFIAGKKATIAQVQAAEYAAVESKRRREAAAVTIQSHFRGFVSRRETNRVWLQLWERQRSEATALLEEAKGLRTMSTQTASEASRGDAMNALRRRGKERRAESARRREERAAGAEKLPEGLDAAQVARLAAQFKRMQQSDTEDED
tara:strand:+ start:36 stop:899 length:864 start_codon:yes stop_codon:yes gene_type:complete